MTIKRSFIETKYVERAAKRFVDLDLYPPAVLLYEHELWQDTKYREYCTEEGDLVPELENWCHSPYAFMTCDPEQDPFYQFKEQYNA